MPALRGRSAGSYTLASPSTAVSCAGDDAFSARSNKTPTSPISTIARSCSAVDKVNSWTASKVAASSVRVRHLGSGCSSGGAALGVSDELHRQLRLRYPDDALFFERLAPGLYRYGDMEVKLKIMRRCLIASSKAGEELPLGAFLLAHPLSDASVPTGHSAAEKRSRSKASKFQDSPIVDERRSAFAGA